MVPAEGKYESKICSKRIKKQNLKTVITLDSQISAGPRNDTCPIIFTVDARVRSDFLLYFQPHQ